MAAIARSRAFFDTSVLLGGLIDLGAASAPAQEIMNAVAAGRVHRPRTAWHCCLEFYAVATRLPEELRLSPADAWRLVEEELLARFEVAELTADHRRPFFRTAVVERVSGGRIYDAHIAEIACQGRAAVVVTENVRHFTGLAHRGIAVMNAAQFAEAIGVS